MTLILSVAMPRFVVQVSDRMLTNGITGRVVNDKTNKLVLYSNDMAFGYTGLGTLEGQASDEWLCKILSECSEQTMKGILDYVAQRANEAIKLALNSGFLPKYCRLAFVGVGWTKMAPEATVSPIICRVCNFYDSNSRVMAEPEETFSVTWKIFGQPQTPDWGWLGIGAALSTAKKAWLTQHIQRCAKRGLGPSSIIRLCKDTIRQVARDNKTVGNDLLAGIIPITATGTDPVSLANSTGQFTIIVGGPIAPPEPLPVDMSHAMRFLYLPSGKNTSVDYWPRLCSRGTVIGNIHVTYL